MSKAHALPGSPLKQLWLKWRFHLNVLLILIPLGFMPKYFADAKLFRGEAGLGANVISDIQVGPYRLDLAELRDEAPAPTARPGTSRYSTPRCARPVSRRSRPPTCASANRAACAPPAPFSLVRRTTWARRCPSAHTRADAQIWITLEGWDGSLHQASVPLAQASPATVAWLENQGGKK